MNKEMSFAEAKQTLITPRIAKLKEERDKINAQRQMLQQRNGEIQQQDQELVRQIIRLDGQLLEAGYLEQADTWSTSQEPQDTTKPLAEPRSTTAMAPIHSA